MIHWPEIGADHGQIFEVIISARRHTAHNSTRTTHWATIRPIQIRMIDMEATALRTNPSKILLRTDTDSVSGKWEYEERTCWEYTASLLIRISRFPNRLI